MAQSVLVLANVGDFLLRVLDITGLRCALMIQQRPAIRPDARRRLSRRRRRRSRIVQQPGSAASARVGAVAAPPRSSAVGLVDGAGQRAPLRFALPGRLGLRVRAAAVFVHSSTKTETLARSTHGSNGLVR